MDKQKLYYLLDKFFAYDTGSITSGINDLIIRKELFDYLKSLSDEQFRIIISTFVREQFLSEKALKEGYGIEDVVSFSEWLEYAMLFKE